jgi:hypothetical protein
MNLFLHAINPAYCAAQSYRKGALLTVLTVLAVVLGRFESDARLLSAPVNQTKLSGAALKNTFNDFAITEQTIDADADSWLLRKARRQFAPNYRPQFLASKLPNLSLPEAICQSIHINRLVSTRGFIVKLHDSNRYLHLFHLY